MAEDFPTIKLEITPYQALQICRWKKFMLDAVRHSDTEKQDQDGILEALFAIDKQVRKSISIPAIEDAVAEREVKRLIG